MRIRHHTRTPPPPLTKPSLTPPEVTPNNIELSANGESTVNAKISNNAQKQIPPPPKILTNFDRPTSRRKNLHFDDSVELPEDPSFIEAMKQGDTTKQTNTNQQNQKIHPDIPSSSEPKLTNNAGNRPNTQVISKPAFAAAVQTKDMANVNQIEIRHCTHLGKPTVFFSAQDYFINLAQDCKMTIVGKFYRGKPAMEDLRKQFVTQFHLKGSVKIAFVDSQTVYIDFTSETDYKHIYFKPYIYFGDYPMKVLKWTPDFKPEAETTIVHV